MAAVFLLFQLLYEIVHILVASKVHEGTGSWHDIHETFLALHDYSCFWNRRALLLIPNNC